MDNRNPSVFSKPGEIFAPFSFTHAQLTSEEETVINEKKQAINGIIDYLNTVELQDLAILRQEYVRVEDALKEAARRDNFEEVKRLEPKYKVLMTQILDGESRKQLVNILFDEHASILNNQQGRLGKAVTRFWKDAELADAETIKEKNTELNALVTSFVNYGQFAYLKAKDLALVAQMLDDLLYALLKDNTLFIKNDEAKKEYEEVKKTYIASLKALRFKIYDCMQQHIKQDEFNRNLNTNTDTEQKLTAIADSLKTVNLSNSNLSNSAFNNSALNNSLMKSTVIVARDIEKDFGMLADNKNVDKLITDNNDIILPLRTYLDKVLFKNKGIMTSQINVATDITLHEWLPNTDGTKRMTVLQYFQQYNPNSDLEPTTYFSIFSGACQAMVGNTWFSLQAITEGVASFFNAARDRCREVIALCMGLVATITTLNVPLIEGLWKLKNQYKYFTDPLAYYEALSKNIRFTNKARKEKIENKKLELGFTVEDQELKIDKKEEKDEIQVVEDDIHSNLNVNPHDDNRNVLPFEVIRIPEVLSQWKNHIEQLASQLESEINARKETCLPFFSPAKKETKLHALLSLRDSINKGDLKDINELKNAAEALLENKVVTSGWFSRTGYLLEAIVKDVQHPIEYSKRLNINSHITYKTIGRQL